MLILQNIAYAHPNKQLLFSDINITVQHSKKLALVGNNGTGKSTLLKIIAGELQPLSGQRTVSAPPYYLPQIFGQFNHLTIAQALRIDQKLHALHAILNGHVTDAHYASLNDDWTIEERCTAAIQYWQLSDLQLTQKMGTLSGGQKTKVFLAGIAIHQPDLILLDEPSNHLDMAGRRLLYDFIRSTKSTLIVVSHDRKLLNLLGSVCELSRSGIQQFGGNYDFYKAQQQIAQAALHQDIQSKEKELRKARDKERETLERQQKLDNRGKAKQEKAGVARIMMNTMRNNAELSTAKLKNIHAEKTGGIAQALQELRSTLPDLDKMKFGFDDSALHKGKILCAAREINFSYHTKPIWKSNINFEITSGERIAIKGANGSGKTTLIQLILGNCEPHTGTIYRADYHAVYIDQDYSLLNNQLSVYEQAQQFNSAVLQEHEIKIRLNRFLFTKEDWDKNCAALSGGERMRLLLCCLTIRSQSPDMIILDEPTNNIDIQNIEILTVAIQSYRGTLIVVSHDETFLEQIQIERTLEL
ncbi:MAG TPA: ABC-F family ATP-binding cassette domain-containing protein [Phnomibacter sp.]|nr:ABC-F family ATP-binding cassette domain-containing protein [Phnomibacter sp.]